MAEHLTSNQKVLGSIPRRSWVQYPAGLRFFFGVSLLSHILLPSWMIYICDYLVFSSMLGGLITPVV